MPFLLYCICEAQAEAAAPATGVRGAPVQQLAGDGLRCFYSELEAVAPSASAVQQEAVEFYRVVHSVFEGAAIVPFRFPTLLQDTGEIAGLVAAHAEEYAGILRRLRGAVQMEIRIAFAGAAPRAALSGSDYLRARADAGRKLEEAAEACRGLARPYTLEWRRRTSRDGFHCFALVPRAEIYNLQQALRALPLDAELKASISGPWPATEFFKSEL